MTSTTSSQTTPTVSRALDDGTLIELLFDPTARTTHLAVRHPDGAFAIEPFFELPTGERLVPYAPTNNLIASGCVLLPSDIGDFVDKRELVAELKAFIHRYLDLSPLFEELAAYYALLTWVSDCFNEIGYLRLRGSYGSGKTRGLITIGSLCYKPFFASGASTVSPIFHVLDAFGGTLVLDEADFRFSDATAELTKVLNNGTVRGLPVLRTMTNRHRELNPTAFRVFGPKLVGMRESFEDAALESRFLSEDMGGRPLRSDIPIHLPDQLRVEACALRNKLLAWRFSARSEIAANPARLVAGLEPRLNQSALALLTVIDDEDLRERIGRHLLAEQAHAFEERGLSEEAALVSAIIAARAAEKQNAVRLADVSAAFHRNSSELFEVPLTNKRIGWIIRTRLRIRTTKSNGVYVIPHSEWPRIDALASRYGVSAASQPEAA